MKTKNIFVVIASLSSMSFSYAETQLCFDDRTATIANDTFFGACFSPIGSNGSSRTDNNIYMGLVWKFGNQSAKNPDILIGFRTTKINFKNNVKGADLNIRLQPTKNYAIEGIRLSYLGGNNNTIINLGGGYSFNKNDFLTTAAIETSHIRFGSDYLLSNKTLSPFVEVNTLNRIKPVISNLSCPEDVSTLRRVDNNFPFTNYWGDYYNNLPAGLTTDSNYSLDYPFVPAGSMTCFAETN